MNASGMSVESPQWFVLNHIRTDFQHVAKKEVERFNAWQGSSLELFAPTYVAREEKEGEIRMRTVKLTFHYVFLRGTFKEVKKFCGQDNGFSFLIDRSSEDRYATVADRDMANFKNIARAYKNCLPYFPLDQIDLEEGDLVEVVNGDFPGLVGTYMPRAKSNSGNIILNVYNNVGTIAFNVRATDVRVLEFSRKSTRANDQIDAVVPHLFKALRYYSEDRELPVALAAKLSVFCSRMEVVRLSNRKLNARLQAILYAANLILGNVEGAAQAKASYAKVAETVTNEWTAAMIRLIFAVTSGDLQALARGAQAIGALTPSSRLQKLLAEEYTHYLLLAGQ